MLKNSRNFQESLKTPEIKNCKKIHEIKKNEKKSKDPEITVTFCSWKSSWTLIGRLFSVFAHFFSQHKLVY